MKLPPIVSAQEWDTARERLLVREKEVTRARDALAAERRRMPRQLVDGEYVFDGPDGRVSLLDLFAGRRQQVAHLAHLNARDTRFANVSRAPKSDIERLRARMGWWNRHDEYDAPTVHEAARSRST